MKLATEQVQLTLTPSDIAIDSRGFIYVADRSKQYIQKYNIDNLWKYDLPNAWRLIYTIETDKIKIINIILEWFNHKNYEKKFKY